MAATIISSSKLMWPLTTKSRVSAMANFRSTVFVLLAGYVSLLPDSVAAQLSSVVDQYLNGGLELGRSKLVLKQFKAPLPANDTSACLAFLEAIAEDGLSVSERTRKNDLADWMLQRREHVVVTTEVLLEIIDDEAQDLIWREYCVQKLAMAFAHQEQSVELRIACIDVLERYAADSRISFSGSALLGLYRLHQAESSDVSKERTVELAEAVLISSDYPTANKVSALQIAGLLGSSEALEYARSVLADTKFPLQLRVSAVALLGSAGNESDLIELRGLSRSLDYRLRNAAESAILNLSKK